MDFQMNYTQFIPRFENPKLTTPEIGLHILALIIAPINILLCSIFLVIDLNDFKRYHPNFCILRLHMLIAFYCISIARILSSSAQLFENSASPEKLYIPYVTAIIIGGSFGTDLLRYLWIAIFIERFFATIYSNTYENGKYVFLPILLSVLCYGAASIMAVFKYRIGVKEDLVYIWNFSVDFLGLISIYFLSLYNRRLRKLKEESVIKLSQRYQITENLRAIKIILPIIVVGLGFTVFGSILRMCTIQIETLHNMGLFRYAILIYYLCFNIYVMISLCIWIKRDDFYRKKFLKIYARFQNTKINNDSDTKKNSVVLLNVEGKEISMLPTMETHFDSLKNFWNH